ncbi:hypothetical protein ACFW5V_32265 [Streptomyces sp. NPDC058762]|uniref:hypothetical protein n=1 Tax=Streptomyces sp. NPDC058762 TaxID=3346629 RepID=UPI0036BA5390
MSDPYPPLPETLARIRELSEACGKPIDEVLNAARLSHATGVAEPDVQTLLAGGATPDIDLDVMVRDRVRFLYETRTDGEGNSRDIRDIAAAIDQTTTWTKKLVTGDAKPNILVGAALTKYYDVASSFLTDPPADAVNRELQPILFDLQVSTDPGKALRDLGVVHIAGRSPQLHEPTNLTELAKMVASIASDLKEVNNQLERMQNPGENR